MSRSKQAFVDGLQAKKAISITPSDSDSINTQQAGAVDAVFLTATGAGNVTCTPAGGGSDVVIYLAQGAQSSLLVSHVKATGTTATGIVGLFS